MNISKSFGKLIMRIQPTEAELSSARQHVSVIKNRLTATFKINRFVPGGSLSRETYIRSQSDVDLFAVISRSDVTWGDKWVSSTTTLNNIRDELAYRYPKTPVGRDVHAVVVEFSQGQSVDVVPAVFDKMLDGKWPQYWIPDGDGGWMAACPARHNAYINAANLQSGGKLRRVAQLLKFWRECRSPRVPLSSFHIEMILASLGICKGVKTYAACVTEVLQNLASRECRALQDPLGIAGNIAAVKTDNQRESALASIRNARDHAKDACVADYASDVEEAWRQWNIAFNYEFPK